MERLTKKIDGGTVFPEGLVGVTLAPDNPIMCKMLLRLAAYEDTGLDPEEVLPKDKADEIAMKLMRLADLESLCGYTRLRELAEADKDGRVVVLPCKVGDTVWAASGKIIKCEIDEIYLCDSGGVEFLVSFNCDGADCKRCPFNNWTQDSSGECYCDCEYGSSSFKDSDIGKTVFLTREEAKEALEAMREEEAT